MLVHAVGFDSFAYAVALDQFYLRILHHRHGQTVNPPVSQAPDYVPVEAVGREGWLGRPALGQSSKSMAYLKLREAMFDARC